MNKFYTDLVGTIIQAGKKFCGWKIKLWKTIK